MLNSQPLGFYDPSDLTQDARRHGVRIHPVDVNLSHWDHTLIRGCNDEAEVRLGFRLVKSLSRSGADQLLEARKHSLFQNAADLVKRGRLNRTDQQALAVAGALASITTDRHHAQWDLLGVESLPGILSNASAEEPQVELPLPTEGEDIVADYTGLGLTLGRHPLALLREQLRQKKIMNVQEWSAVPNGKPARVAGIIKVRQRPGSASGVLFLTLEDETGNSNIIVWPQIVETFRREVLGATMVAVSGQTQREGAVVHLVARKIEDLSWMLGKLATHSRDFH